MKVAKPSSIFLGLLVTATSIDASTNDLLNKLTHPFSSSSEAASNANLKTPTSESEDIQGYDDINMATDDLSLLDANEQHEYMDDLPLLDANQLEDPQDGFVAEFTNLRQRRLGSAQEIKHPFYPGKCADLSLGGSSKGNLYLYHECHGGWNQKFSYNSKTEQIKTGDKCWDYNLETGNLYGRSCHQWSNQKWYIDDLGRIRSKRDHKCVDIRNGNDMYLRDCCDSCEGQRWFRPDGFPNPRSEIKPFYDKSMCLDFDWKQNIILWKCHSGRNQQFIYSKNTERIFVTSGPGCLDESLGGQPGNVQIHQCHGGSNQKWYWDDLGRIRNRRDSSRCLESAAKGQGANMQMAKCSNSDRQRFLTPKAYPTKLSQVTNIRDSKCWDLHTKSGNNLHLGACNGGRDQQFYFVPESGRILDAYGAGCLDINGELNAYMYPCHGNSNQRFYTDRQGRLRCKHYPDKCLTADRENNNNLVMRECRESMDQTFLFPSSFELKSNNVKPFFDQKACWDVAESGNVLLHS